VNLLRCHLRGCHQLAWWRFTLAATQSRVEIQMLKMLKRAPFRRLVGPLSKQRFRRIAYRLCGETKASASCRLFCDKLQAVKVEREPAEMNQPNTLSDDAFAVRNILKNGLH